MKTVPFSHVFEIPEDVAICPYCQAKMYADIQEWAEESEGLWTASSIETTCDNEPDIESDEFDDYVASHSEMPYVYLLPVHQKIEDYINKNFRFAEDEQLGIERAQST